MKEITLNFGKHRGKKLEEVPRDYVQWLSEKAYSQQVREAAQAFLADHPSSPHPSSPHPSSPHPSSPRSSRIPGPPPRTRRQVEKLSWMAARGYGNAKATLLAARDERGFLCVYDDEDEDEESCLFAVSDEGYAMDAMAAFEGVPYEKVKEILSYYPRIDGSMYLVEVEKMERMEREEAARRLVLRSRNGNHTIILLVYRADYITVEIDGQDQFPIIYRFRMLSEEERRNPMWKDTEAVLEPDEEGAQLIGLTRERRVLVEQKIQEQESRGIRSCIRYE